MTVTSKAVPAVATAGAVTLRVAALAGLTAIVPLMPVIDAVTVSVAVMVRAPEVVRIAPLKKVWVPLSAARKV